ncbi:hypothetical protein [Parasphingorhabdus sp.]|jgi:hypothetical protein|uniref:hypothetical protein n=1 Tax=Parasphingorhabdus sp. TaxID=2709688 RepID=UPI0039E5CF93
MVAIPIQKAAVMPDPDTVRSFCADLAREGQIHLVSIAPDSGSICGRDFASDVDGACNWALEQNETGKGVYWTVNSVASGIQNKPKKTDIAACRFAHADIDPPKDGAEFDRAAALDSLVLSPCPPSFIIDSGNGLQAFWRLDEPCENTSHIEAINKGIQHAFKADSCFNVDRLMRVPGLINWPNKKKLAAGRTPALSSVEVADDGVVYKPEELAAAFPQAERQAPDLLNNVKAEKRVQLPTDLALFTPDSLGIPVGHSLRNDIEGPIPERHNKDRSRWGQSICRQMAYQYTDAQIAGIILNPANPCSAHYLDHSDPLYAATNSISKIRKNVPEPIDCTYDGEHLPDQFSSGESLPKITIPKGVPGWLRDLEGSPLGDYVNYVCDTAHFRQPEVTLASGLSAFGAAAGRRYRSPTNLRTNIYTIGLVDSGGGKDHPLQCAKELLIQADLHSLLGGSDLTSGAAIITELTENPNSLFTIDEIGNLFEIAANPNKAAPHQKDIITKLTEFYHQPGTWLGKAYANRKENPKVPIKEPSLSLFGITTPGRFWNAWNGANAIDGSLARMLIFESSCNYPDPQDGSGFYDFPENVIGCVKNLASDHQYSRDRRIGNLDNSPYPFPVPYGIGAKETFDELRQVELAMKKEDENTGLNSINARIVQSALKIALIKSASDCPLDPVLTKENIRWGWDISHQSAASLKNRIRDQISDTVMEQQSKLVERVIRESGSIGITLSEMHDDVTRKIGKDTRSKIIDQLIEAGRIICIEASTGGRPRTRYYTKKAFS